ncbi:transposable element Tc1 transposase [Trichonephila clavipes]|nr:transposable element Tc1 transposase [Trichonephila clavipes]
MRLLEDTDKNGWIIADFSFMMIAVDLGQRQIGRRCVWRRLVQRADPAFPTARHTSLQSEVMVWGAISFDSRTPLGVIRGTLTAQRYVDDILRNCFATVSFTERVLWSYFQQDNARPHTARVTMNCLKACQTLPWPARSLSYRACLEYDKTTASAMEC